MDAAVCGGETHGVEERSTRITVVNLNRLDYFCKLILG